jgi:Flp pilus assembly protein TadG
MSNMKKLTIASVMLVASFEAMAVNDPVPMAVDDTAFEAATDANAAPLTNLSPNLQATPISVDVLTELKVDTTTVTASKPSVPSIDGFWVVFAGPTWTKAVVTIQVTATGLLERSVTLVYLKPTGATGTFYAPFSVSDWTGSTSGKGTATVQFWNGTILLGGANHTFTLLHN